jgi:hypothetical protein
VELDATSPASKPPLFSRATPCAVASLALAAAALVVLALWIAVPVLHDRDPLSTSVILASPTLALVGFALAVVGMLRHEPRAPIVSAAICVLAATPAAAIMLAVLNYSIPFD